VPPHGHGHGHDDCHDRQRNQQRGHRVSALAASFLTS
jgi:hypothetical protein